MNTNETCTVWSHMRLEKKKNNEELFPPKMLLNIKNYISAVSPS